MSDSTRRTEPSSGAARRLLPKEKVELACMVWGLLRGFLVRRFVLGDFRFRALQAGIVGIAGWRHVGDLRRRRSTTLLLWPGLATRIVAAARRALAAAVVALAVHARHRIAFGVQFNELV